MNLGRATSIWASCLWRQAVAGRHSKPWPRTGRGRIHQAASPGDVKAETNDAPTATQREAETNDGSTATRCEAETEDASRPAQATTAPKVRIDVRHIRQNPELYRQNCLERKHERAAEVPERIVALHAKYRVQQVKPDGLRRRSAALQRRLTNTPGDAKLLAEARNVKERLGVAVDAMWALEDEIKELALGLPNLTLDEETPRGTEPAVVGYINGGPEEHEEADSTASMSGLSHVAIGAELGLVDLAAAATTSGWGWYYLVDEGAALEQALVAYALATATAAGWRHVSPPSVVYEHVAAACGFRPRDGHGETVTYALARPAGDPRPELVLAATAEIPLAGMRAKTVMDVSELPVRHVAVSRCYRAEAGARGAGTRGLYRVHEFTKVELFAWTHPSAEAARAAWLDVCRLQTDMLTALGLRCRVLEMPTADLGASAARKRDIEAWFPSRRGGWGEVTSASICTDYQTRRLDTRLRGMSMAKGGEGAKAKLSYPWTVNGTAMAVPRVLAALLENGWDKATRTVRIPEVLRPWMGGKERLGPGQDGGGDGGSGTV